MTELANFLNFQIQSVIVYVEVNVVRIERSTFLEVSMSEVVKLISMKDDSSPSYWVFFFFLN